MPCVLWQELPNPTAAPTTCFSLPSGSTTLQTGQMFRRAARWAGSTALAVALAIVTLHTRSLLITSDSEAAAWRLGQALAGYGGAEALPLDRAMLQGWRAAADAQAGGGNPVVLVPPLLGTALEMQLERK